MQTIVAAAALVALMLSFQIPAWAQAGPATLRLVIVDETRSALPAATVSVYTVDGNPGITVKTDAKGVALFPSLPEGLVEVYARTDGRTPYIEAATLRRGENTQTVMLLRRPADDDEGADLSTP